MKILIVFPYDLYPVLGGGSRRAISLINYLMSQGNEVVVLTTSWHNRLREYVNNEVKKIVVGNEVNSANPNYNEEVKRNYVYYRNYNTQLILEARKEVNRGGYHAIICNFLWTADCLLELKPKIIKVLDIHDLQSVRSTQFDKLKYGDGLYRCTKRFEFNKLSQADIVLCINKKDVESLKGWGFKKDLLYIPYTANVISSYDVGEKQILFVGNKYPPNEEGIKRFIVKIFPQILRDSPEASLVVVGKVCDNLIEFDSDPNIKLLGYVDDLSKQYNKSDVVIAPISSGTGLKIKTVEALTYGKALVAFPEAVSGIDYFKLYPDQVAGNNAEFAKKVSILINNTGIRCYISKRTADFVANCMNEKISYSPLVKEIDRVNAK